MQHIHLDSVHSTQEYLKNHLQQSPSNQNLNCLVTSDKQLSGQGRRGRTWHDHDGCLAMSFTMQPNLVPTLTTLEMSVLLLKYFEQIFNRTMQLKWPNDLYIHNKKVGGCLIDTFQNSMIVGVGINLRGTKDFPVKYSHLDLINIDQKQLARDLYSYLLNHRMDPIKTREMWQKHCMHIDKMVDCSDDQKNISGIFVGVGENGQALLQVGRSIEQIYSATLRIN